MRRSIKTIRLDYGKKAYGNFQLTDFQKHYVAEAQHIFRRIQRQDFDGVGNVELRWEFDLDREPSYENMWDEMSDIVNWAEEQGFRNREEMTPYRGTVHGVVEVAIPPVPKDQIKPLNPKVLAWDGGTVQKLLDEIGNNNRWTDLPILADALEDAGCEDRQAIDLARQGNPSFFYAIGDA